MKKDYCVYAHCKKDTNEVFYIGKGLPKRARSGSFSHRNEHWVRIVKKHGFYPVILYKNLSEQDAFDIEIKLIKEIGRENLCNITDGGEGTSGRVCTEQTKALMSNMFKGVKPMQKTIDAAIEKTSKKIGTTCGMRFPSIASAARYCQSIGFEKASKSAISSCLRGESNTAYGFKFRYVDENNLLIDNGYIDQTNKRKRQVTNSEIVFQSVADAAKFVIDSGLSQAKDITTVTGNIVSSCKGRGRTFRAYGFMWSYV